MTIFKVKADEDLFYRWQDLPIMFEHAEFGAIVQNDMEITNEQLMEWMKGVREVEKQFSEELHKLFIDTVKHIQGKKGLTKL